MLPLGHLAITIFVLFAVKLVRSRKDVALAGFGSLLPDLIDKPLGLIFFSSFIYGRLIAHTLVFNVALLALFAPLNKFKKFDKLYLVPLASLMHIVEDRIWTEPTLLYYPFKGELSLNEPHMSVEEFISFLWSGFKEPYIFGSEVIGIIFIIILLYVFFRK